MPFVCISKDRKIFDKIVLPVLYKWPRVLQRMLPTASKTVASIQNRSRSLVHALRNAKTEQSRLIRLEDFNEHILRYLSTGRSQAIREGALSILLRIRQNGNREVKKEVQKSLALLGWVDPVKGRGIRVLSIDGGGSRGLIPIEILKRIEHLCNQEIHELFDIICGVSTGAILAMLLGIKRLPLEECEQIYKKLSTEIFEMNTLMGTGKLFWNHAFYDTAKLETILKSEGGEMRLIDATKAGAEPKVVAVSTVVNRTVLKPYLFCNYTHPYGSAQRYPSSCEHRVYEALRASSAAPGFFEECKLGHDIHQDGGLLTNNPCAVSLHEAKLLWPGTPFQCIVSLGTGRYKGSGPSSTSFSTVREKLLKIVASATDTEAVDTILRDLLPKSVYFRFNPNMSTDVAMDESRAEVMEQMQADARSYVQSCDLKLKLVAHALSQKKTNVQFLKDRYRTWKAMS